MRLSNFEFFANTAVAVVGATVTPYAASDVHPNPNGPATASVTTDTNGRWDFPSLADGQLYDVKVAFGTSVKWYKGNARLALGHLYDDTTPPPNRNLLENGGADLWLLRGSGALSLPTSEPGVDNEADNWAAYCGAGDVCTAQMDTVTRMTNSRASSRMTYVRAGGQAVRQYALADGIWQQLRGQPFAASAQVLQVGASSRLYVAIDDGVTETVGTITDVIGAWTTISCLKTISASATKVVVRIRTNRTDTGARVFHVDNVMGDQTSLVPVFAPEAGDNALVAARSQHTVLEAAPAVDTAPVGVLLNGLAAQLRDIIGAAGADWKDAIPRTLTQLLADVNLRVLKAGDTMTGDLTAPGFQAGVHGVNGGTGGVNGGAGGVNGGAGGYNGGSTAVGTPSVLGLSVGTVGLSVTGPAGLLVSGVGGVNVVGGGPIQGGNKAGGGDLLVIGLQVGVHGILSDGQISAPSLVASGPVGMTVGGGGGYNGGSTTAGIPSVRGLNVGDQGLALGGLGQIAGATSIAAAGAVTGSRLVSTVADGTAPLGVTSRTVVTNLNAQMLADQTNTGRFATSVGSSPNAIPVADAFGKLDAWVTPSGGGSGTPIPSGLIAAFATAAEIPSGWLRYTSLDGRLPVGAGQVGENLFVENNPYGTSWAHLHTEGAHNHTQPSHSHSGAALGIGGAATGGPVGTGTGGGTGSTFADASHTHGVGSFDVTGSTDGTTATVDNATPTINSTTLLLPMRAVVWARKS